MGADDTLTNEQRQLLVEVIDMHCEGIEVAKEATMEDKTFGDAETFLDVYSKYNEDLTELNKIKKKICGDRK